MIKKKDRNTDKSIIDYPVIEIPLRLDLESLKNYPNYQLLYNLLKDTEGDYGKVIIRLDTQKIIAITSTGYYLTKHIESISKLEYLLQRHGIDAEIFDINFGGKLGNRVYVNYQLPQYIFEINGDKFIPFIQAYSCYDRFLSVGLLTGLYRAESEGGILFKKRGRLPKRKHFRKSVSFKKDVIDLKYWISDLGNLRRHLKVLLDRTFSNDSDSLNFYISKVITKELHRRRYINSKILTRYINEFGNNEYSLLWSLSDYITHKYIDNKKRAYDRSREAQINLTNLFFD